MERDKNVMLSRFMKATQLDAGFAHDLLEGQEWNFDAAMRYFQELQGQRRLSAQQQAPQRSSPPQNGRMVQPTPANSSPQMSGPARRSSPPNGGGSSPNSLRSPQVRDAPKSPGTRRLNRGLSAVNSKLVDMSRKKVIEDEEKHNYQLVDTPRNTFVLPDLAMFPADFRAFVEKDLIDACTMVNLENSGHLNWWAKRGACAKLWPMATTGDGNCLLHAASLGMWGFHDRQLTLRKALYKDLSEHQHTAHTQKLKRRWRWQQTLANKESGLVYSEKEWEEEWTALLKLASTVPRNHRFRNNGNKPMGGGPLPSVAEDADYVDDDEEIMYESLEEFHVFVLCHILRRPIIIVADTVIRDAQGQPLAPVPFGGIYLPVELHECECHRSPLVLTYDASHFSALVPMEVDSHRNPELRKRPPTIPITDSNHQLLPLHFIVDPGIGWQWQDENHNVNGKGDTAPTTAPNPNRKLVYSPEDKVKLLHQYLDLVRLDIKDDRSLSSYHHGEEWELLPPKENGIKTVKVEVSRSNSSNSSGSEKSDRSSKDKPKSIAKRIKHFTRPDKSKKASSRKDADEFHLVEERVGGDAGGKPSPVGISDVASHSVLVAARMDDMRLAGHEEMIRNYLEDAKLRFQEQSKLKRLIAAENRSRQLQRGKRFEQPPPEVYVDDDELTNETAYHYSTIPRAQLNKSSMPGSVPITRQDFSNGVRGVQYINAMDGSPISQSRSNPTSPALRRTNQDNASYNPSTQRQPATYSPQPVRANHPSYQPRSHQPPSQPFERTVPIQQLHIDARNKEIRHNPNPYATHVRGKRVPLSKDEEQQPCRTYGCKYFGSRHTDFLCSKCFDSIMRRNGLNR